MNSRDIEKLKETLTNMMKNGCKLHVPAYGASGRVVGIGFKPYWTNPIDSKIEKLEINFMDNNGRIIPFNFYNVIGYDIVSHEGQRLDNANSISLDIHVYSPVKSRDEESYDKVRVEISREQER
ncbi:MAG: hypothetical protein ACOYWZ_20670 [Bacillota bacterium]